MNRSSFASISGRIFSFKSSNLKYLAILILAMVSLPFLAYGQTATILGTVTDPSGGGSQRHNNDYPHRNGSRNYLDIE